MDTVQATSSVPVPQDCRQGHDTAGSQAAQPVLLVPSQSSSATWTHQAFCLLGQVKVSPAASVALPAVVRPEVALRAEQRQLMGRKTLQCQAEQARQTATSPGTGLIVSESIVLRISEPQRPAIELAAIQITESAFCVGDVVVCAESVAF